MGGWMDGSKSHFKDCLQQPKIDYFRQFYLIKQFQLKMWVIIYLDHYNRSKSNNYLNFYLVLAKLYDIFG